jgi:hypothetical protein
MFGNLAVLLKRIEMKTSTKSPKTAPKKGIPVTVMIAVGKPKKAMPLPMRGGRTATNMMKKSSRGK